MDKQERIKLVSDFIRATLNAKMWWRPHNNFERKGCESGILYLVSLPFVCEGNKDASSNRRSEKISAM